jgi:hypothetical protein
MKTSTVALQIRSITGRTFRRAGHEFGELPRVLFIGTAAENLTPEQAIAVLETPALAVLELDQMQAADAAAAQPKPAPSEAELREQFKDKIDNLENRLMKLTAAGDAAATAQRIASLETELGKATKRVAELERAAAKGDKPKGDKGADAGDKG